MLERTRTVGLWLLFGTIAGPAAPAQDREPVPEPPCTVRFHGRVLDSTARPIPHARIECGPLHLLGGGDPACRTVQAAADGSFDVLVRCAPSIVRTARVGVRIEAKGYASVRRGHMMPRFGGLSGGAARAVVAYGDVLLGPARRIRGQVLGHKGRPLGGAVVRAVPTVALQQFFPHQHREFAATRAEADGRFTIENASAGPVALLVAAEGHFDGVLSCVDANRMVLVNLAKSGFVSGRVLAADGKPTRGLVCIDYQGYMPGPSWEFQSRRTTHDSHHPCQVARTDAEGRFRATIRYPGYFRVRGRGALEWHEFVEPKARSGPAADVELRVPASAGRTTLVRVVDRDGQPVRGLVGAAFWHRHERLRKPSTAAHAVEHESFGSPTAGSIRLFGPADETLGGAAVIRAPGFAPGFLAPLSWPLAQKHTELTLAPESGITGQLVGPPELVSGVTVSAYKPRTKDEDRFGDRPITFQAVTDAKGRFSIRGMTAGTFKLGVPYELQSLLDVPTVAVAAGKTRSGLRLVLRPRQRITASFSGKAPADACLEVAREYNSSAGLFGTVHRAPLATKGPIDLGAYAPGRYRIALITHRGASLRHPARHVLKTITITDEPRRLELELPAAAFAIARGTVHASTKRTPWHRFVVAAVQLPVRPPSYMASNPRLWMARHAFVPVGRDGEFTLAVSAGKYELRLVDIATGIEIMRSEPLEARAGKPTNVALRPDMAHLRVDLAGAPTERAAECTSLLVQLENPPKQPEPKRPFARIQKPQGTPVFTAHRPRHLDLYLPAGGVRLVANVSFAWAFERKSATLPDPFAEAEVTLEPGSSTRKRVRTPPLRKYVDNTP